MTLKRAQKLVKMEVLLWCLLGDISVLSLYSFTMLSIQRFAVLSVQALWTTTASCIRFNVHELTALIENQSISIVVAARKHKTVSYDEESRWHRSMVSDVSTFHSSRSKSSRPTFGDQLDASKRAYTSFRFV